MLASLSILFCFLILGFQAQLLYNHQSSSTFNATWMATLDNGIPIRQLSIIGSHSSMSQGAWGDAFQTQSNSLTNQMMMGMRALDIRCRHYNNALPVHDRLVYLNTDLGGVLNTVRTFLQSYPTEVILMHIVQQYNAAGNSRTFEQTFLSYQALYTDIIWVPTSQNPFLGEVRGKVVIIQDFPGSGIHGLLYSTFTVLPHRQYSTNWDQYSKWLAVKSFLASTNAAGSSRISFWTGNVGSFPYFVASGKSSPGNGAPLLATGLTTPGFSSSYPDFPRVACFIGICTIAFQGINILAYNYIVSQSYSFLGIVFTDFVGESIISKTISLNVGKFTPCPSTLLTQGCTYCSSTAVCLGCNTTTNYVYISSNNTCAAADGFYLVWSAPTVNSAVSCSIPLIGCLKCLSDAQCTQCDVIGNYALKTNGSCGAAPGYYLDVLGQPIVCPLQGCYECLSASVCLNCSAINNYVLNTSQQCECDAANLFVQHPSGPACVCTAGYYLSVNATCQSIPLCPANNSGCLNCNLVPTPSCSLCDSSNHFIHDPLNSARCICLTGYFYDGLSCNECNTSLSAACLDCASSYLCLSCTANFTLQNGDCVCLPQYYQFDADTCLQCAVGCLRCSGGSSCDICDEDNNFTMVGTRCQCLAGMFLNGSQCELCGSMPGCLTCNTNGCTSCDPTFGFNLNASSSQCECAYGYFINQMNVCEECTALGTVDCIDRNTSRACTSFFNLSGSVCVEVCGDGVLYNLECDDGNTVDGDGCSSTCQVQIDYTCVGGTQTSPSLCSFSGTITVTIANFTKDPNANKVYLTSIIAPALKQLAALDFNTVFLPNFPVASRSTTYEPTSGTIQMEFTYDQSLNDGQLSVQFVPPAIPAYFYMEKTTTVLPAVTSNNLALKVYTSEQYDMVSTMEYIVWAIGIVGLVAFLLGIIFSSKLMALEMVYILQVGYGGLLLVEKKELLMVPVRYLRITNGYNDLLSDNSITPGRVSDIYYRGAFLSNFNLNIVLALLPLIIGLIILIVSKVKKQKNLRLKSYRFFKEWELLLLLFVLMQLEVSQCLSLQYETAKIIGFIIGGSIYVILVVELTLFVKHSKNFGEFKDFFKIGCITHNWYLLIIAFRVLIGLAVGAFWQSQISIYILLGIAGVWMMLGIILRPYLSNIRPVINNILIFVMFGVYFYCNFTKNSKDVTFQTSYIPIALISVLIFALIFNIVWLILHKVRQLKQAKKLAMADDTYGDEESSSRKIDKDYILQLKEQIKDCIVIKGFDEKGDKEMTPMRLLEEIKHQSPMRINQELDNSIQRNIAQQSCLDSLIE